MADTHTAVRGSKRVPLPGSRALGRANAHTTIEVSLKLRPKNEIPDLTGRPAATMSREELAEKYGASGDDIDKVTEAFQKFGLTRVEANAATRTVRFSGTVAQMENAFQVKLFDYAHPDGNYRGRIGQVSVPAEVKDVVRAVFGILNEHIKIAVIAEHTGVQEFIFRLLPRSSPVGLHQVTVGELTLGVLV